MMILEHTKQVTRYAIVRNCSLSSDAYPIPKQWSHPPQPATPYKFFSMMLCGMECPSGQFESAIPAP